MVLSRRASLGFLLVILVAAAVALAVVYYVGGVAHGATLVVDSLNDTGDADPGDGVCDDGTGKCTLRAAIEQAAAGDTINVRFGVYTLNSTLTIDKDLTIIVDAAIFQGPQHPREAHQL